MTVRLSVKAAFRMSFRGQCMFLTISTPLLGYQHNLKAIYKKLQCIMIDGMVDREAEG